MMTCRVGIVTGVLSVGDLRLGYDSRSHISNLVDQDNLPEYVREAKFDSNSSARNECDEGTRQETLDEIHGWLDSYLQNNDSDGDYNKAVLWLHGFAGSGKSTILQTVAERCERKRRLGGSFFCSLSNKACSNVENIFPTVA